MNEPTSEQVEELIEDLKKDLSVKDFTAFILKYAAMRLELEGYRSKFKELRELTEKQNQSYANQCIWYEVRQWMKDEK